ncbi:isoprenylcysteine carboxyl methyltransferase family protein [Lederbergia wuyishanensis]|uniref:Methyltransferase n=1 Tax=Lederbergia wuyishanensis TaxID=1347903 RepID=A0ABU0D0S8_9BACI|nr:isoprenylcysteine carboxylmethyltransferase family protein [Lederbergia wuyishanensis]MCJ8006623.1 hypothetical protein [Lederbergia wuyishanensis]MDQ0342004.1 methyltransferase [Lederbergia wuyishanensis]
MFFLILLLIVIAQRLIELRIAKRNEEWMLQHGAKEYGQNHYFFMVLMHAGFFISLIMEYFFRNHALNAFWPVFLLIFIVAQIARIWVITSLGKYWNTKIIVLPGIKVVKKGPFKYVKHPNYIIVTIELFVIPMIFNLYITATLFLILNQIILKVRIPIEEKALSENTDYTERFD